MAKHQFDERESLPKPPGILSLPEIIGKALSVKMDTFSIKCHHISHIEVCHF